MIQLCGQDHTNSRRFAIDTVKEIYYPYLLRAIKSPGHVNDPGFLTKAARGSPTKVKELCFI
jgi:hypothetical protein